LKTTIRFDDPGFALEGVWNGSRCQYFFSPSRRRLLLDSVEQRRANEYLTLARVVWFGNNDLDLIRGGSEDRRRFMDFAIVQRQPTHRMHLRRYEKALRSRNALLKTGATVREIEAYNQPLVQSGNEIRAARRAFADALNPAVEAANREIGGKGPSLRCQYVDGTGSPDAEFAEALAQSSPRETRLHQTMVGPHRDDLELTFDGRAAAQFASEGQQRTAALALRLGQAEILHENQLHPPLFLVDDIFGELDVARRNRLLERFPADGQQLITTTHLNWIGSFPLQMINIESFGYQFGFPTV